MRTINWVIKYCSTCKIIFDIGEVHDENGCTDNIYNSLLINGFTFDEQYEGMPTFKSYEEFCNLFSKYEFDWICTSNGSHHSCTDASYPKTKTECDCARNISELDIEIMIV